MGLNNQPPAWARRFLKWYCRADLLEEIQGDLEEIFERTATESPRKARLAFVWNVIRFCRLRNIRRYTHMNTSLLSLSMLKSYALYTLRSIRKNQFQTAINIIGLSLALGCGITVFLILDSYYHRDGFHSKGDRVYLFMNNMRSGDVVEQWARSPYLAGPALLESHGAVEAVVRIQRGNFSMRRDNIVFNEPVWFTDPDFLNVFNFDVLHGRQDALTDPSTIALTQDVAIKYFGKENVINEEIQIKLSDSVRATYRIGAVLKNIPDQSSMHFGVLVPIGTWEKRLMSPSGINWRAWAAATFVLLREGHQAGELQDVTTRITRTQNQANEKFQIESVEWIPLSKVAERSYRILYSLSWSNVPAAMIGLGVIAALLVLLACINYMNVAVASVSTRLKEIGVRKVIGGGRRQIIYQFMIENIVFCTLAMGVGTAIAALVLLPGFNSLFPIHVPFAFSSPLTMIIFFAGSVLGVAFVSGAYPAFYVSSFDAVTIMRGREKFGSKSLLSKVMLTVQFVISFSTVVAGFVFINSSLHFEKKDWGYQHDGQLYMRITNAAQYHELERQLSSNQYVIKYAGTESHIGSSAHNTTVAIDNNALAVVRFEVGFDYLETMQVRLKNGRMFNERIASDVNEAAIVNESFVKKAGWTDPIGKSFDFDGHKWFVIGVAENFNYQMFYFPIEPVFIHVATEDNYNYIAAHVAAGHLNEVSDQLRAAWNKLSPDDPYTGDFQNEVFGQFFRSNRSNNKIMITLSVVALALAMMGLYGLMSYNLTRRLREFSIRSIFGASRAHIIGEMNRDYVWIVMASFCIAAPLGWALVSQTITAAYPEYIPIPAWPFILTAGLMVLTVAVVLATQLNRLRTSAPADTLKNE